MIVREISTDEYTNFINSYSYSSVLQTTEYGEVMKNQGYQVIYIGLFTDQIVGASLIMIQKIKSFKYAYAPRGILMDYSNKFILEEFTREIKKFLLKLDVIAIKLSTPLIRNIINKDGIISGINPKYEQSFNNLINLGYHHFGYNSLFEAYKPRFEALIDLTKNTSILFDNIKKEYKTKIRSAEKKGIKIYRANSNDIDLIYEQAKNKYPRDLKYFQDSFKFFSENNKMEYYYAKLDTDVYLKLVKKEYEEIDNYLTKLNYSLLQEGKSNEHLVSKKMEADLKLSHARAQLIEANKYASSFQKGIVLASMLIAKNQGEIYLYMDGYDTKYKSFNAKHLLMWKIIEKYSELGYKRLNLGGVTDIRLKDTRYTGLNSFKTNFNSSIVEYAGDFELIINQAKYFLYRQIIK